MKIPNEGGGELAPLPKELIASMERPFRPLIYTQELQNAAPDLLSAFSEVDAPYLSSREGYLGSLFNQQFTIQSDTGEPIKCALLAGYGAAKDKILVTIAPFADEAPTITSPDLARYATNPSAGFWQKQKVRPNSWNQMTKAAVYYELFKALGEGLPVLTIFRPSKSSAYSEAEQSKLQSGDFSPAGKIVRSA